MAFLAAFRLPIRVLVTSRLDQNRRRSGLVMGPSRSRCPGIRTEDMSGILQEIGRQNGVLHDEVIGCPPAPHQLGYGTSHFVPLFLQVFRDKTLYANRLANVNRRSIHLHHHSTPTNIFIHADFNLDTNPNAPNANLYIRTAPNANLYIRTTPNANLYIRTAPNAN
ncbi:hypothetical protein PAAG_02120 [Paracoccidioides lutzii Pb01]|uniref:Uncharacterized protein n=1 Tax=Paracoccidioides lutzii (strain ATCC MYA-826 / Pb01) TaxID=502779 RepID=C1GUC5_PARBA|nr:hypothetical protein PAAG_02120 [Paracoccidioides lutzii Pb01]EEH39931.2 hypothetical protein PAAG_02120 [Paracoccidioides lutzii Pb01]